MNFTQFVLRKVPAPRNGFLCVSTPSNNIVCNQATANKPPSSSSSSDSSSDSDGIAQKKKSDVETLNKLNILLQRMVIDDQKLSEKKLDLARPTDRRKKHEANDKSTKVEPIEKQVVDAVKGVAQSIGDDAKQTESELLMKLLNPAEVGQAGAKLSDIIKGMKIDREEKLPGQTKAEEVRQILQKFNKTSKQTRSSDVQRKTKKPQLPRVEEMQFEKIDLFGSPPLGIFTDQSKLRESPQLKTWQKLYQKELQLAVTHPPTNYFQQMILWTEQGKVWQFPIDNEFGLDQEAKVYFADHVFLEEHLEPWCPSKGPIRHFMELVCVGLSKNPYLTVEAKKEHIQWYKNYFEDKKAILQEIGAIPVESQGGKPKQTDEK